MCKERHRRERKKNAADDIIPYGNNNNNAEMDSIISNGWFLHILMITIFPRFEFRNMESSSYAQAAKTQIQPGFSCCCCCCWKTHIFGVIILDFNFFSPLATFFVVFFSAFRGFSAETA